jgi:hypothetical protein
MSNTVSLDNINIKIVNVNIDTYSQHVNFTLQAKNNPTLQTSVHGAAPLSELQSLSQDEIMNLIWTRAAPQCASWIQYISRSDLHFSSLAGCNYTPINTTITLPSLSNMGMPGMPFTPAP